MLENIKIIRLDQYLRQIEMIKTMKLKKLTLY